MRVSVRQFLTEHPTTGRWLDDIIDVAHVNTIAREMSKSYGRDIDSIEQTVTRRLNDFCSDAKDFKKGQRNDLFARVEAATYRLRSHPEKPNIIELIRIEFEDATMQNMWREFADAARKSVPGKWNAATNEHLRHL